jgi:menaquinone-9 beta-reductase
VTRHFDAIIVGGGVGGGAAAKYLAEAGRSALVLEAGDMPRWSATCSGIFGATFAALDKNPSDYPGEILEMPTSDIYLVFGGKYYGAFPEHLVKPYYDETLYFTLRGELEEWILGMSDAELRTRVNVRPSDIDYVPGGKPRYRVRAGGEEYTADYLIGAGGTNCPVRRRFFKRPYDKSDLVVLLEAEIESSCHGGKMFNHFYFNGLVGFGWLYPKGREGRLTNLGVCEVGDPSRARRTGKSIKEHWLAFVEHLQADGTLPADFDPGVAEGSSLYLAQPAGAVRANDDTCFIIGDAAALAHRDLWNGITSAIQSGKLAARHIAGTARYTREAVYPYLFKLRARDSAVERRVRDFVLRNLLRNVHLFLEARRGPSATPPTGKNRHDHPSHSENHRAGVDFAAARTGR